MSMTGQVRKPGRAADRRGRLLAVLLLIATVPSCCKRHCVPEQLARSRDLVDLCATDSHAPVSSDLIRQVAAEFTRRGNETHPPGARPYQFLALSGGGLYGSFGVGVLNGWTASGTRPTFDVVTGISTGALMSTFAFLGPAYDQLLRDNLVGVEFNRILRRRHLLAIPFKESIYSSDPLAKEIERLITPQVLHEVALAHAAGRRLYIGTTILDTRGLAIWDMGDIASRGTEKDLALYRAIVLASASIPVAFPPIRLPIEIDGCVYEEMHVDGSTSDGIIFRAFMVGDLNRMAGGTGGWAPPGSRLHLISNGKLYADPSCVQGILPIFSASISSLLSNKSRDELHRIYLNCLQTGVDFRLTAVPRDLPITSGLLSVTVADQRVLYEEGYRIGAQGVCGADWRDTPPGTEPREQALPRSGTRFASPSHPHLDVPIRDPSLSIETLPHLPTPEPAGAP